MIHVNTVMLSGRLTREPVMRATQSGTSVGSFGLAVNERYTTRDGEEREKVLFADVQVWGRQAESCAEYLGKGSPVLVEGKLETESWEDRSSGQRRSRTVVRALRVQFLEAATGSGHESRGTSSGDGAAIARRADSRVRSGGSRRAVPVRKHESRAAE